MPDPTSLPALAPIATVVVLLEVAAGTTVAAYAVDLVGKVGRGFVGTTSLICAGVMALDVLLEALLPSGTCAARRALPSGAQASLFHWSIAFTVALLGVRVLLLGDDRRGAPASWARSRSGSARWRSQRPQPPSALRSAGWAPRWSPSFPRRSSPGSALAGMLLGHWYLVAPNLSFRPLRRAIDIVFIAVALQAAVIVLVILTSGVDGSRRAALVR